MCFSAAAIGCGSKPDSSSGSAIPEPSSSNAAAASADAPWSVSKDIELKDGWKFRVTLTMGARSTDSAPRQCLQTAKPGTENRAATVTLENRLDRNSPLPGVTFDLVVGPDNYTGQWTSPNENCSLRPWSTTFGSDSDSILAKAKKESSGGFTALPENETAGLTLIMSVSEPNVVGGAGDQIRIPVPPLDETGAATGPPIPAATTTTTQRPVNALSCASGGTLFQDYNWTASQSEHLITLNVGYLSCSIEGPDGAKNDQGLFGGHLTGTLTVVPGGGQDSSAQGQPLVLGQGPNEFTGTLRFNSQEQDREPLVADTDVKVTFTRSGTDSHWNADWKATSGFASGLSGKSTVDTRPGYVHIGSPLDLR